MSEARQRILEVAGRLFAERGYELVGINELIEKSGVAKATFYQQFRSKQELCTEWLRRVAEESEADARALLAEGVAPERKLVRKFDRLAAHLKESEFRGCPFSNTAVVVLEANAVRTLVDDYKAANRRFWQDLAGLICADSRPARMLGDALFLLFSGAVTEAQNAKALWPVTAAKSAALALCQAAAAARQTS
jgi:AcrR family transcriptional regulator